MSSSTFGGTLWGGSGVSESTTSAQAVSVMELLLEALRYAGVTKGPGRTPSTPQINDSFLALKRMLNRWAAQKVTIPAVIRSTFAMVAGTPSYEIGPDSTVWTAARPMKIEHAGRIDASSGLEDPIKVFTDGEWAEIGDKDLESITAGIWYSRTLPNGTVYPWPVPSAADSIALYVWDSMTAIPNENAYIEIAPAYPDAIVFNLAWRLWLKFKSPLTPMELAELRESARTSFEVLERSNIRPAEQLCSDVPGEHQRRGGYGTDILGYFR